MSLNLKPVELTDVTLLDRRSQAAASQATGQHNSVSEKLEYFIKEPYCVRMVFPMIHFVLNLSTTVSEAQRQRQKYSKSYNRYKLILMILRVSIFRQPPIESWGGVERIGKHAKETNS